MTTEPLIELRDVAVTYEGTEETLVRDVNWSLARGEFWAVSGDQGSGKTSLLTTMAGLQRPSTGTVLIQGRNLVESTEQEQMQWRSRIGFVFELHGRLLNHLTVAENIALPLQYHRDLPEEEISAKVDDLLARAELTDLAHMLPGRLTPRLQQRISLLRALAVPTEVLFLDNPLSGLAPSGVKWWLEFLRKLRTEQLVTVVATGNHAEDWRGLASRQAVLENGNLRVLNGTN